MELSGSRIKKIHIFWEIKLSSPKIKKVLIFSQKSFPIFQEIEIF